MACILKSLCHDGVCVQPLEITSVLCVMAWGGEGQSHVFLLLYLSDYICGPTHRFIGQQEECITVYIGQSSRH